MVSSDLASTVQVVYLVVLHESAMGYLILSSSEIECIT